MPELVLVRHGETVGQSSIRLYGATDVELAPEGASQVQAAGRSLTGERFDAVFTSPLQRARRSAELVLESMGHPAIAVEQIEGFREVDFGNWEGWTWAEVAQRDPEGHARWAAEGPAFTYPGGEPKRGFVERVQLAVAPSIEARLGGDAQRILAVVHKGVIKAIAARMLGVPFEQLAGLSLPLGAVRRMRSGEGGWVLVPDPNDVAPA